MAAAGRNGPLVPLRPGSLPAGSSRTLRNLNFHLNRGA